MFTLKECQDLISLAERQGFEKAKTGADQVVRETVRKSGRVIIDDPTLANTFFQRIRSYLPQTWSNRHLAQLNERLRFLKYTPQDFFAPHYDASYERPDMSQRSFVTMQIYLNGDKELGGGATTIFDTKGHPIVKVLPGAGRVLLFEHEILHEGSPVPSGTKYAIRWFYKTKR